MSRILVSRVWSGWAIDELREWENTSYLCGVSVDENEENLTYNSKVVKITRELDGKWYLSDGAKELLQARLKEQEGITIEDITASVD